MEANLQLTDAECSATVTRLINLAGAGDASAAEALLPLVYQQLRRLARQKMRHERSDQTLQATALVHDAYLRVVDQTVAQSFAGRWHFFAAAAEAMRRILVDNARRRGRLKRGGNLRKTRLDPDQLTLAEPSDQLLALDEALTELAQKHPEKAQLVKLRYFSGLTIDQAAEALAISPSSAQRYWVFARAWLYRRIHT